MNYDLDPPTRQGLTEEINHVSLECDVERNFSFGLIGFCLERFFISKNEKVRRNDKMKILIVNNVMALQSIPLPPLLLPRLIKHTLAFIEENKGVYLFQIQTPESTNTHVLPPPTRSLS